MRNHLRTSVFRFATLTVFPPRSFHEELEHRPKRSLLADFYLGNNLCDLLYTLDCLRRSYGHLATLSRTVRRNLQVRP